MVMQKIAADRIYTGRGKVLENHLIEVDQNGKITDLRPMDSNTASDVKVHKGVIVPGFVNAHCHLELSHMKGLVRTGEGLLALIKEVVTKRKMDPKIIKSAIVNADREMWENGIVAVGDISNVTDTFQQKSQSPIHYHTFVEMFDFLQEDQADEHFDNYFKVYKSLVEEFKLPGTIVPHAPYSVSKNLFKKINDYNRDRNLPSSIHMMETTAESDLFMSNSGEIVALYEEFGVPTSHLKPSGKTSVHYAMEHLDPSKRIQFVHNTLCSPQDIRAAEKWGNNIFWTTCPSANLYLENRLPRYRYFRAEGANMTIGTDSLTSNWGLSILEEMKVIARYQSGVPFEELIQWATFNGARALMLEDQIGSIEVGKKPGINLLHSTENLRVEDLGSEVRVKKLA